MGSPAVDDRYSKLILPVTILSCCMLAVFVLIFRPGYLTSTRYLAALIFLQITVAAIWNYRQRFLVLLLVVFLWAGMPLPMRGAWVSGRWFVLIAGALVGFVIYMKDRDHHFGSFHLAALAGVLAAVISALVSAYPEQAILKAFSLLLLFLYGASGARLAVMGREAKFFNGLLLASEVLVYISAIAYFVFRFGLFDNPNSLGAVMGVAVVPALLWGVIISERGTQQRRRTFAFLLALGLLLSSYARAGIAAGMLGSLVLCVALRQYRLLIKGMAVALLLAVFVVSIAPIQEKHADSLTSSFVYKGHREEGVLGSRLSVWQRASEDIQEHPWFGTGFGTSATRADTNNHGLGFRSNLEATREHGNSYLAIVEWVGLLGVLPFFALVVLVGNNVIRVMGWMRRTGDACSPAVPIAAIMAAGLLHAAFEDWLFAAGYYLCVFFWSLAFVFIDVVPKTVPGLAVSTAPQPSSRWANSVGVVVPQR
jgi:O-antigen ligase